MYIYVANKINNPIYIHFLCGNKYSRKKLCVSNEIISNKRKVLADYIGDLPNHYPIILEEFFTLNTYKENKMGNLKEIELMMSYLSTSVMIIQETFSTAAEIGVFGNINDLANKMLVIYPSTEAIEYDCVGAFIREAFFTESIVDNYEYLFKTLNEDDNIFLTTYFTGDKLDADFISILNNFFDKVCKRDIDVSFSRIDYYRRVGYFINKAKENESKVKETEADKLKGKINITLSYEMLFYSLLAAITTTNIINDARDPDEFTMKFSSIIKDIFSNTIEYIEKINTSMFSVSIEMLDGYDINMPIKFIYFLLRKLKLIRIVNGNIIVTRKLSNIMKKNGTILMHIDKKHFFGDENNEKGL